MVWVALTARMVFVPSTDLSNVCHVLIVYLGPWTVIDATDRLEFGIASEEKA